MENPNQQSERLSNEEMLTLLGIDQNILTAELDNAVEHYGITEDEFRALDTKVVLAMFTMFCLGAQHGALATVKKIDKGAAERFAKHVAQAEKATQN